MKKTFLLSAIAVIVLAIGITAIPAAGFGQSAKFKEFQDNHPKAGDMAPDFTLKTRDGEEFKLSEAVAKQPVVIEFGSYT
jgi:cytochrome oxidase Cu insertion factor (SCO1/SenC/PrrC family)